MIGSRSVVLAAMLMMFGVSAAAAQVYRSGTFPRRGSIEAGGGGTWSPGFEIDSRRAELSQSTGTDSFDLFTADSRLGGRTGGYARLGMYLTRALSVEAGVRYARPILSIRLSGDAESAEDEVATETLTQYLFDGSVLWHFTPASFGQGRGVPFISAGGGHLRELHEQDELVETGRELHVTAGLKYWSGIGRRRAGFRGEIGLSSRDGGIDSQGSRRSVLFARGGLTFLF